MPKASLVHFYLIEFEVDSGLCIVCEDLLGNHDVGAKVNYNFNKKDYKCVVIAKGESVLPLFTIVGILF